MDHDIHVDGWGFRLRPVTLADAGFIVELRAEGPRTRWVNPVPADVEEEREWLRAMLARPGDWTFIVERMAGQADRDPREGMVAIYDLEPGRNRAEWGRWAIAPGSLAAAASALLVYETAFTRLGLAEIVCRTVTDNRSVVGFHDRCGLEKVRIVQGAWERDGMPHDLVEHRLSAAQWPAIRARLVRIATMTERMLTR